jgi:hypothetical protein
VGVIIWQNVGETILGAIAWQVCSWTWLLSANVFQLLKFFRESEIWVGWHHTIVLREVLQPDWIPTGKPNLTVNDYTNRTLISQVNLLWWNISINVVIIYLYIRMLFYI